MPSQTGSIDLTAQVSANNNAKDYSDNVVDTLEIGGRNLLLNSKTPLPTLAPYNNSTVTKYNKSLDGVDYYTCSGTRYWRIDFPTLVSGETYNLWFDIARSSTNRPVFVKIGSTEQNVGTALVEAWKRLGLSFVASTDTYAEIRVAIDSTGTAYDYIAALRNIKLEKGDKATDWTPAPEDVDADISAAESSAKGYADTKKTEAISAAATDATNKANAAAQTATNYITADVNGISIHMANESNTYQRQTSNSTTFYVGGKKRSAVGADGLHVYVDSTEDEVAHFGATARIGYTDDFRTVIGPGRINMLDGTKRLIGIAGGKIKMGQYGSFEVTDTGFNGYGRDGSKYVSLAVNGTGSVKHFVVNIEVSSGETFYGYSFPTAQTHTQNLSVNVDGVELVENTDYTFRETAPSTVLVDGAYFQEGGNMGIITLLNPVSGPIVVIVEYDREVYGYDMRLGLEEYTNFRVDEDEAVFTSKDGSKVSFDYHSLRMVDKDGREYFEVRDLLNSGGVAEITETFTGDGQKIVFYFTSQATDTDYEVIVSDASGGTITKALKYIMFSVAPTSGAIITVTHTTNDNDLKAYTFGQRRAHNPIGKYSLAEGYQTTASGSHSHAEGYGTSALGDFSHSEGFGSWAEGNYSHSEGRSCDAIGNYSHAQNNNTIAAYSNQTAIGKFNDNQSDNAFEIGNGTNDINGTTRSNAATIDWNGNYIGQAMAGIIQMFAGATPPTGWLVCDGSAISRTTYATLFAAIGTTWGSGNGSTTFNIPDLRGRAPIGAGTGSGLTARTLGGKLGAETHTLTPAQTGLRAHTHAFTQPTVKTTLKFEKNVASGSDKNRLTGGNDPTYDTTTEYTASVSGGAVGAVTGGEKNGAAHNNMQPSAVVNFIICTGKTS